MFNLKTFLYSVFILIVTFAHSSFAEVGQLSNEELKKMMDNNVPIIDIRRADEWKSTGIIQSSYKMTFFDARGKYDMTKWLAELDKIASKDEPFVLICRSGNRTGQVSNFLDKKLGYKKVYHLKNGIKKWIKAGDTVVAVK